MQESKSVKSSSLEVKTPALRPGFASVPLPRFLSEFWSQRKTALIGLLLFGLVVWTFWPSLHCGFLFWDDTADVINEPHVNSGFSPGNIAWAFCTLDHCNWYPLNWLSHMLDCEVYGLNPWGHHLTNILIHALNSVLVFVVFKKMTGAIWRSLAVALVFALHPLRVESVTWICERKDVLSLFFWMLTLLAYARYAQKSTVQSPRSKVFYGLSLLAFACGLMSKAMLVTLPFVLLLLDYWPLELYQRKSKTRLLMEKLPFLALALADSWITFKAQQIGGLTGEMSGLSNSDKLGNALISYVRYLGKFFWPANLSIYYPHPGHWPLFKVMGAGFIVLGISILVLLLRRRMPYLLTGWFWYLGTLVPVIGLVQLLSQSMADRYTYIPVIGFAWSLVWLLNDLTKRWRYQPAMMLVIGTSMIFSCVARTRCEIGFFKDDVTLWRRAVAVTKDEYNWCPHYALGIVLLTAPQRGDPFDEFQESVRINPNYAKSQICLGKALGEKNRFNEAIIHCQRALELEPDNGLAWFNCGLAFLNTGELEKTIGHLERAVQCEPNNAQYHITLDAVLGLERKSVEMNGKLREAVRQNPDQPVGLINLAWFLATNPDSRLRNGAEAVRLARRARRLPHEQSAAMACILAMADAAAAAETGRFEEAITNAQLANSIALESGEAALVQKSKLMLELFRAHQPYYERALVEPPNHQ
jgi:protein O-mannosyl-transferase